jgi:hypothetical protein
MSQNGELDPGLLVSLCRRDVASRLTPAHVETIAGDPQWNRLLRAASEHHLEGLVLATVERIDAGSPDGRRVIPAHRLHALRLLRRRTLGWDLEQARVIAWLEKHAISPVVLKGCALRHAVYAEPAERPVADLDLLFARTAVDAARKALVSLGYEDPNSAPVNDLYLKHHFHTQLRHPGGFAIELHWGLTPPGPGCHLDPDAVRESARRVSGVGPSFLAPSPEYMVLHLASQSLEDSFERLGRLVDVDRVIARAGESFDWELLRSEAARGRLGIALGLMLRLAERLFETPLPAGFVASLGIPRPTRRNLAALAPAQWVQGSPAARLVAARVIMRFWLEASFAARSDVLLKAFGLRSDPMKLLHDAFAGPESQTNGRVRHWVPSFLKIGAYQVAVWMRATPNLFSAASPDPFW